jgi:hypothetical protein
MAVATAGCLVCQARSRLFHVRQLSQQPASAACPCWLLLSLQSRWSSFSGPQLSAAVLSLHRSGFIAWPDGLGPALAAALAPHLGRMQAHHLMWAAQVRGATRGPGLGLGLL